MKNQINLKNLCSDDNLVRINTQEELLDILIRSAHEGENRRVELLNVMQEAILLLETI